MSLQFQAPNNRGSFIPVAIDLAAASWGQYLVKNLVRFKQGRQGAPPNWEGHGKEMTGHETGIPITDREYWAGRYVLCELTIEREDGGRIVLPDAVLSVSRERRIVSTPLTGRDGSVKEYINEGDWVINMIVGIQAVRNGTIADEWPDDELRELCKFLDEKAALRVHSAFLDVFGITRIVIKSRSVSQTTEQNYQAVNISAVSDDEYVIYSNEY